MSTIKSKMSVKKSKYWACVVYQESAAENWINVLKMCHVKCVISPLHDKDFHDDGTPKKPHWHVLFIFDGITTEKNARFIIDCIKGVGCEKVMSLVGTARYLCHLDNPEKALYDLKDAVSLCGADIYALIDSKEHDMSTLREIAKYCEENNIISYAQLNRIALYERPEWFETVVRKTQYLNNMLKSKGWTDEREKK